MELETPNQITFRQKNAIIEFLHHPILEKYIIDREKIYDELDKLTIKQASEIISLRHQHKISGYYEALGKLKGWGIGLYSYKEE